MSISCFSKFTFCVFRVRGRRIVANLNVQFTKLYVGGIPKDKTREQIFSAFAQEVDKLTDVVIQEPDDVSQNSQNRGESTVFSEFCEVVSRWA